VTRAILLVDHGSRRREANELLERVAEMVAERVPDAIVRCAHMDLAEPNIAQGIAGCVAAGARQIVVHPYFLAPGSHATDDIPRLVRTAAANHPDVDVRVSEALGLHPKLVDVILDRLDEATS
jgi:sirohydrochlorin ferrochelatase